ERARQWLGKAQQQGLERAGKILDILHSNPDTLDARAEMTAYATTLPTPLAPPTVPEDAPLATSKAELGLPSGFWPRILVDVDQAQSRHAQSCCQLLTTTTPEQ
ncbi:MAG: hypothetical protein HQL65_08465, partial [Magnetococcales bacterium]|nr:hypothetical protein [Magnetococcales bacterium]